MKDKLYSILMEMGIHPDCIDAQALSEEIYRHMQRGLDGAEGSLMICPLRSQCRCARTWKGPW